MVGPGCYKWYRADPPPRCGGLFCLAPQSHGTQRGHCVCMGGGGGCLSHPTSDRGETSCHYISMVSSQPSRRVLKSTGPFRPEADNIFMVGPGCYMGSSWLVDSKGNISTGNKKVGLCLCS